MSQGWRLPDGTPCGRTLLPPDDLLGAPGSTTSNSTMLNTGYCYNGQCRPFNCRGEMHLRTPGLHGSSNVYSGTTSAGSGNETMYGEEEVDCSGAGAGHLS